MASDTTPPGLRRARLVARLLDDAVPVPGTGIRVGLDAVVGLLPIAGDLVTAVVSLYIVVEAARLGVPLRTLLRMLLNVALDLAVGSIPLAGDAFDVLYRANRRNVRLLERHVEGA